MKKKLDKRTEIYTIQKRLALMNKKLNKKGVTLIELVIVMVIIAIGAVLIAPNIGRWLPNYRLRSATRDIVSMLRTAHVRAVSNNMNYRVRFTEGTGSAGNYVLERNSGGIPIADGPAQTLPSGIQLVTTFNNDIAEFRTNSTADGGTVVLQNPQGAQRAITVALSTGRITIQ